MTLIVIVLLILLACGGVPAYRSGWTTSNPYNLVVLVALVLLVLWLFGLFPSGRP